MNVFVIERYLAIVDEFDTQDTAETIYSVIFDEFKPVATARLLIENEQTVRIGRVATLKEYRGQNLGSQVVSVLEACAIERGYQQSLVHAELTAEIFYQKMSYSRIGEPYTEDGVDCITLMKVF
ncbi:hypothetical protein RV04_GL001879 [Enterococcus hermanniensis]|uniref:N-acetyltransferase domain-containing protein n=2 Tax=Enterococcus hermanniensis TaxID=249189 RepID=A0A1L8TMU1_9ENTE|nr:hypothetical protein RV04_GL001879 [Enterococcus hermanniensis]